MRTGMRNMMFGHKIKAMCKGMRKLMSGYKIKAMHKLCIRECVR